MSLLAVAGGPPSVSSGAHRPWPEIGAEERSAVTRVLDRGELWGPNAEEVSRLQEEWAAYVGSRFCLMVNSGTAALHCAVVATGVSPGDEVIVPAFGFVATPMAVLHAGAIPVFCDIDPLTFNLDVGRVEDLISERTSMIMPVHAHGLPAEMDELRALASRRGLAVVEDAAQAHGAMYHGAKVGSLGDAAAFSLNGSKQLSAGEGGLFVTDDEAAFVAARRLAIFGEDTPPLGPYQYRAYWSHGLGWNYRSHELTAALARSGLRRLDVLLARVRRNAEILDRALGPLPGLTGPYIPADRTCSFYRYRIRIDPDALDFEGPPGELRDRLLWALREEGVAASLWQLLPLPAQPVFRRQGVAPWQPGEPTALRPWDRADHPTATRLLERSIVLGTAEYPLWAQPASVVRSYVDAFHKVIGDLDAVLSAPHEPVEPWPPHA